MERLMRSIKIGINEKIYLKDPESSDLGKRIVEQSILMIHEMGFESFTFRKLGEQIQSNESSVYRYFENKHKLLLYLASWYWGWLEYKMVFATNGIPNPTEKLRRAIEILTQTVKEDVTFSHVNEVLLNKIVINEYSKSYLTKEVDLENKEGYFVIYKRLVQRLHEMIITVDKDYPYPSSLASTILEGSLHQYFLKEHFPNLTDCDDNVTPTQYFTDLVFRTLTPKA
ncbi:TetR/AcrR family transcriptional regulator [Flagellimonas algicola]|uniref:TetR/AcrR family transcriptional regulator n=1 Tax=Flagellimonas algicola TaxID=2583815 RepID=A0ABY2WKR1_9FLAO|nr:TetR/AcrR family transcriptional regulator [Allomuricauda algicola]TMU55419.1 TetR/AcrR family transcriptional regulator [Allomuricauda algicola]